MYPLIRIKKKLSLGCLENSYSDLNDSFLFIYLFIVLELVNYQRESCFLQLYYINFIRRICDFLFLLPFAIVLYMYVAYRMPLRVNRGTRPFGACALTL